MPLFDLDSNTCTLLRVKVDENGVPDMNQKLPRCSFVGYYPFPSGVCSGGGNGFGFKVAIHLKGNRTPFKVNPKTEIMAISLNFGTMEFMELGDKQYFIAKSCINRAKLSPEQIGKVKGLTKYQLLLDPDFNIAYYSDSEGSNWFTPNGHEAFFGVGLIVQARTRSGWEKAVVQSINGDGTSDVKFDSGKAGKRWKMSNIRQMQTAGA